MGTWGGENGSEERPKKVPICNVSKTGVGSRMLGGPQLSGVSPSINSFSSGHTDLHPQPGHTSMKGQLTLYSLWKFI